MTQSYLLGAYWASRNETLEQCTGRLSQFLQYLVKTDESLGRWFQRGQSRKEALAREINPNDRSQLIDLLELGRNRRDIGNEILEDLGFQIGLWNGASDEDLSSSLSVHCGAHNERVGNSITLSLPGTLISRLGIERIEGVLSKVCESWQPDWAGVMSKEAMRARNFSGRTPFVDWMVYVPRVVRHVPSFATLMPLDGLGTIVTVQGDPPNCGDLQDLQRVRQVEDALAT